MVEYLQLSKITYLSTRCSIDFYRFLWKAPNCYEKLIKTTKLFVDLLKNLIDMLMKYLYLRHVAK